MWSKTSYPVTAELEKDLNQVESPIAKLIVSVVGEYEHGTAEPTDIFDAKLIHELEKIYSPEELRAVTLQMYVSVARDLAFSID